MPSDDWWTGSEKAGVQRSLEMDAPLPPAALVSNPLLQEMRNIRTMAGDNRSILESYDGGRDEKGKKKKITAAQAAKLLTHRAPPGQEASWRLWSPQYGQSG